MTKYKENLKYLNCSSNCSTQKILSTRKKNQKVLSTGKKQSVRTVLPTVPPLLVLLSTFSKFSLESYSICMVGTVRVLKMFLPSRTSRQPAMIRAGRLDVLSRVASRSHRRFHRVLTRSHLRVALRSQGTNFETKIFIFRCFLAPLTEPALPHPITIQNMRFRFFCVRIPLSTIKIQLQNLYQISASKS